MSQPAKRPVVVLLGASNLTRGIAQALAAARLRLGSPADFYVALGAGRSYGMRSGVMARDLPGITTCGLWAALASRPDPSAPVRALLCDVGNDLLYLAPVPEIEAWLRQCLERLRSENAQITMLHLPLVNAVNVTKGQLALVRQVFAKSFDGDVDSLRVRAHALAEVMDRLAAFYGAELVQQRSEWYGFDPIHFKKAMVRAAWSTIFASWGNAPVPSTEVLGQGLSQSLYLWTRAPERRWLFGRERCKLQPSGRLDDGSTYHLY